MKPNRFTQIQHRGFGKLLMENAEAISSEEFDAKKLAVISGIGVRDWFYGMGYELDGVYVSKVL
jgi:elongator complex protein 3